MGDMRTRFRQIIAGTAWTLGSFIAWVVVCNLLAFLVGYLYKVRGGRVSEIAFTAFVWAYMAGFVLVPAVVAVLAIRAYLPGTGVRGSTRRGFKIEDPQQPPPQ